jgi:hypothetical protein
MQFFFDDSGNFSFPKDNKHKISLWAGIAIPETRIKEIESKLRNWENILKSNEKKNGEAKGSLLRLQSRKIFFDFMDNESDIIIYPTVIDLQEQKKILTSDLPQLMSEYGIKLTSKIYNNEIKYSTEIQSKRFKNLSAQQILKVMTLGICLIETFRHTIIFRSHNHLRSSWDQVEIWIDRSSRRQETREEQVFLESLGWLIYNYTKKEPFSLIAEIHDKNHPFVINFDTPNGINGNKLLSNLNFEDSTKHWGLRFADIAANTLYKALIDLNNTKGMLPFYKRIMKHNHLGPGSNLGLLLFVPGGGKKISAPKYSILKRMLSNER